MHECPWCGQACDCDGEDTWLDAPEDCICCPDGDLTDSRDEDYGEICDCGREAFDNCGFCGRPLCPMCYETGAGFCHGPHTQEQIDDYARSLRGEG